MTPTIRLQVDCNEVCLKSKAPREAVLYQLTNLTCNKILNYKNTSKFHTKKALCNKRPIDVTNGELT